MSDREIGALFAAAEIATPIEKDEYEVRLEELRVEILNCQYDLRKADFSVVVVIAGDDRPGCSEAVHALTEWLDARYLDTHAMFTSTYASEEERERPGMWRYWRRLPRNGRIGIFIGGWATHLVQRCLEQQPAEAEIEHALDHIAQFERNLASEGALLLKFWLHLPKDTLEKRLTKAGKKPKSHWEFDEHDWEILESYDAGLAFVERMVRHTDTPEAPWIVLDSRDGRTRNLTIAQRIHEALARRLESPPPETAPPAIALDAEQPGEALVLDTVDLSASLDKDDYEEQLDEYQARINAATRGMWRRGISAVMVFEGWDAAGKGGVIRRLTRAMPVRAVNVVSVAAPTPEELAHHYLWRFWWHIPRDGRIVIFDRSWYGRVLVERVEGFASVGQWSRAYAEINDFEAQLVHHGLPVLKFWLHIDSNEQLRRFKAREKTPYKKYKLTEEDYRNREKWPQYSRAVHDMVVRTDSQGTPWHLVAANDKRWARIQVLRTVCERLEARLAEGPPEGKKKQKRRKNGKGKKGRKKNN